MTDRRWLGLMAATLLTLLAAACGLAETPPAALGSARWQLTVSPQEPAAGIKAEVTLQRLGPDGKRLKFLPETPVPVVRARKLDGGGEAPALPRLTPDHRGARLYDLTFPATGRWQVAFDPSQSAQTGMITADRFAWPAPPVAAPAIVRDAVGDASLSLVVQVIPDRGPLLWFLRTRILEVVGVVVILLASVASYVYQQRRTHAAAGRS